MSDFIAKTDARRSKQARFVTFGFSPLHIILFHAKSILNVQYYYTKNSFEQEKAYTNGLCNRFLKI